TMPRSLWGFSPVVSPVARTILPSEAMVSSCSSAAEQLCDFVCDCSNCSDENQCGYLRGSVVLGTPFTCDFEDGNCGWQDVSTSAYRWVRGRARLGAWGTGPHSDHTVGTDLGWFMVTVYPPAKTMATAWLRSPVMQEAAAACEIRAWYHLSGSGLNQTGWPTLRLTMAYGDEVVGLWQSPESAGEGWHQLVAYPGRIAERFQLIFSLTQPPTCGAEVALDDIVFVNCGLPGEQQVCGAGESRCSRGSCLAQHRFCDGTDDCGDGSDEDPAQCKSFPICSFEQNLCGWEAEAGQPAWERNTSLSLGSVYGVPGRDHSSNSRAGFFLHLGPSAAGAGSTARLSSPTLQATNSCSLVLYCHLHGSATSSLSISYVTNSSSTKHLVKERMGDLGSCWVRERVDFNVNESFKVLIEGAAGGVGTVAIDDLILSPGCVRAQGELVSCAHGTRPVSTLPSRARAGSCAAEEVACDSGGCIGAELVCDFTETCADGSDEKRCGESGEGGHGWEGTPAPHLRRWMVVPQGLPGGCHPVPSPGTGPQGPAHILPVWGDPRDRGGESRGTGTLGEPIYFWGALSPCPMTVTSLRPELSCNFERGTCGWYQDRSSDFQWVHGTGQGQGSDHTTGSGYFLAADPSAGWSRGQRAQLVTYLQEPAAAPRCLSFWYRLAGPQIGTLSLKLRLEGAEETLLWTRRGTQGSIWHRGQATLPATGRRRYRVAFEALRDGFLGDMALDDLALTAGSCGAQRSCSFEADACGLVASGQQSWLRQSNGTGTTAGPAADHTTGTATGHYMVVSTGWGSLPAGGTAALTSQPYQPSAPAQCLAFWYQLSARTPGSLSVFVEQSGVRRQVMGVSAMEGDVWHRGHVTVQPDGDWQAVFEAVGAGGDHGYIALDDLHVSDGACPEPASCDFEQDTCGWSSPSDHGFAWGWKSGDPLAKYPGPEQDHTRGTRDGHYMHLDTSVLGLGGTSARLESQPLPAAADSCLRFWYHTDIPEHLSCGELRVMLRSTAGQRTVWSVAGCRSQGWRGGVVPVQSPSEFQIIFEVTTWKWPMEGTVALDDITYSTGGGCHSSPEAPVEEKPMGSLVAEVVLGLLLAAIVLALVAAGGWYWLKQRGLASGTPAESSPPQGFDNITFRDDKVIISPVPKEGDED
ncbi:AEGP protein, partial [Pterocles burchelli]|nr:AEGP protein [Pterocles burchelli]